MTEQTFAIAFVDFDGELKLLKMRSSSLTDAVRDFLCKQFPESVDDLNEIETFDALAGWCEECECQVDVLAVA